MDQNNKKGMIQENNTSIEFIESQSKLMCQTEKEKRNFKDKKHKCPYEDCESSFTEKGNLTTHIRSHTGEKPFRCEYVGCNAAFSTKGNLKTHIFGHDGNMPHRCLFTGCEQGYSSKSRLATHMRTHLGIKPFKCPLCDATFNENGNLKTHLRIHTGERPYACTYPNCSAVFKAHGHLNDHKKRHSNLKPHSCNVCDSKFNRLSALKKHNFIHTGHKPYECPFNNCQKTFADKGNMNTHLKKHLHYKNFFQTKIKMYIRNNEVNSDLTEREIYQENLNRNYLHLNENYFKSPADETAFITPVVNCISPNSPSSFNLDKKILFNIFDKNSLANTGNVYDSADFVNNSQTEFMIDHERMNFGRILSSSYNHSNLEDNLINDDQIVAIGEDYFNSPNRDFFNNDFIFK